ncbi:MAG: FAD-binding protein [Dehalococcoidia bacterium]
MKAETVDTDVLVIGGGAAGCSAALKAHELGARVLMVVKGKMGRSGATAIAAYLSGTPTIPGPYPLLSYLKKIYSAISNIVPLPLPSSYSEALENVLKQHYWLVDQDYFLDSVLWVAKRFYPSIENNGLYLLRDEDGKPVTPPRFPYYTSYKTGMSGYQFGEAKRKEVLSKEIGVLEEAMAFALLTGRGGGVVGAMALDYARGRLYAIRAKSTILATGHTNWISKRATGTREMAANGLAMAARVGAEFENLEIQWFHASDTAYPECWMRMQHYPNPLVGTPHQAVMVNSESQEYMRNEDYAIGTPYTIQMKMLYQQVKQGRARWDGGNYTDYRLVDPEALKKYQYNWEFYEKLGVDGSKEPLESAITWHMSAGGVKTDPKTMETNIPGLYIAGAVGAHQLGAIPLAAYDGALAGTQAIRRAQRVSLPEIDGEQVKTAEQRIAGYLSGGQGVGIPPIQVKKRIREVVWDRLMFVRREESLKQALEQLGAIQEEMIPNMRLRTSSSSYNTDLIDALDAVDMVEVCEMVVHAALARRESRGPHFREDFPVTDNLNWLKHVVVSRDGEQVTTRLEPVRQKYVRPKPQTLDYFANPYE